MLAEIIRQGETACAQQLQRGTGDGQVPPPRSIQGSVGPFGVRESDAMMQLMGLQVTLMELLSAYEAVLGRHGVQVAEDSYYYRLLLKLSLDPGLDWWTKFQNVCRKNRRSVAEEPELLLACHSLISAACSGHRLCAVGSWRSWAQTGRTATQETGPWTDGRALAASTPSLCRLIRQPGLLQLRPRRDSTSAHNSSGRQSDWVWMHALQGVYPGSKCMHGYCGKTNYQPQPWWGERASEASGAAASSGGSRVRKGHRVEQRNQPLPEGRPGGLWPCHDRAQHLAPQRPHPAQQQVRACCLEGTIV